MMKLRAKMKALAFLLQLVQCGRNKSPLKKCTAEDEGAGKKWKKVNFSIVWKKLQKSSIFELQKRPIKCIALIFADCTWRGLKIANSKDKSENDDRTVSFWFFFVVYYGLMISDGGLDFCNHLWDLHTSVVGAAWNFNSEFLLPSVIEFMITLHVYISILHTILIFLLHLYLYFLSLRYFLPSFFFSI